MENRIIYSPKELFEIFPEMPMALKEKIWEEKMAIVDAKIRIVDSYLHSKIEPEAKPICEAVMELISRDELEPRRRNLKRLRWEHRAIASGSRRFKKSIQPNEIKMQVSLKEIVEIYGLKLIKSGKRWIAKCPFHPDKNPSFVIYPENNFHCFGCQVHGDIFKFIQLKQGLNFKRTLHVLVKYIKYYG